MKKCKFKVRKTTLAVIVGMSLCTSAFAAEMAIKDNVYSFENDTISKGIQQSKADPNSPAWIKNANIQLHVGEGKPQYSFETVNPLLQSTKVSNFTQFRIGNDLEAGTVANIGFGNRVLSDDKKSMVGFNVFYDYGFKYGHQRVGLGGEYFWGNNEFRVNTYRGISSAKEVDTVNHVWERVLNGYDYEVGTSLPNAPWAKVFIGGYHWDYKYTDDVNGWKVRSEIQVTKRFDIEIGTDKEHNKYAKFMYSLSDATNPAMFEDGKKVFRTVAISSIENKRLQKVNRDNNIEVERYAETTDSVTGDLMTITMNRI